MKKEETYRSITYLLSIFLIFGLFINFEDEFKKAVFGFLYNLVGFLTFIFAYLWIKKRIVFIGLVLHTLGWNIELLTNPFSRVNHHQIILSNTNWISSGLHLLGLVCLIIGFINSINIKYLTIPTKSNAIITIGFVLCLTAILQIAFRLI